MIHLATTADTPDAGATSSQQLGVARVPVLLDFCAARRKREPRGRVVDTWELVSDEAGRAVSTWRMSSGLTLTECARAARVSTADWTSVECPSRHRIGRAFPVWRVLTWVMAAGGPRFHLDGLPPGS